LGMREDFDEVTGGNYKSQTRSVYKGGPVGPRTPQCLAGKVGHLHLGNDRNLTQGDVQTTYQDFVMDLGKK
jgi:hypothetical protein